MALDHFIQIMLPQIESELQETLDPVNEPGMEDLHLMMSYHLGWEGEGAGTKSRGKRLRPLLTLLTTAAGGGQWKLALPAAAAVELIHNFSLIHDDIEDNSPFRRGRPTVWKKWGIAQAINTGDTMLTLGHLSLIHLTETTSQEITLQAVSILQKTCLHLTQGQYLDIAYESQSDLTPESYWTMVSGKTAALLSACTHLGALIAEVDESSLREYREFGRFLGLAFQAQDDLLGIWGDANLTGKSNVSDLLSGKKTLPVVYGLAQNGPFADQWSLRSITPEDASKLANQLEIEGALAYTQNTVEDLTDKALKSLENANPQGEAGAALIELTHRLLNRQG